MRANRVGPIMVLTGFAWFAGLLIEASPPWLNTIGSAVQSVWIIGLVYVLLSFPAGRLAGRLDRWLVAIGVIAAIGRAVAPVLLGGSGLHGLADRIDALGGRFTISSPAGRRTTLRAEIPCA